MGKRQLTPDELAKLEQYYLGQGTCHHQDFFKLPLFLTAEEQRLVGTGDAIVVENPVSIIVPALVVSGSKEREIM